MTLFDWRCLEQHPSDAFLSEHFYTFYFLNRLLVSLKELDSVGTFKSNLKTFVYKSI